MDIVRNVFYVIRGIISFSELTVFFIAFVSFYLAMVMVLFLVVSIIVPIFKGRYGNFDRKSLKIYLITIIVSGAIYYACGLYFDYYSRTRFSTEMKKVSVPIPTGLKVDFSKKPAALDTHS